MVPIDAKDAFFLSLLPVSLQVITVMVLMVYSVVRLKRFAKS